MKIVSGQFDGAADLPLIAKALGFSSVVELVLDRAVFPPASIVRETACRPIVNTVRAGVIPGYGKVVRGGFIEPAVAERIWGILCDEPEASGVLADDNMSPHFSFVSCFTVKRNRTSISSTHLAHVHGRDYSKHPRYFTSLANLVLAPSWLSKPTDGDPLVCQALRFIVRVGYCCRAGLMMAIAAGCLMAISVGKTASHLP